MRYMREYGEFRIGKTRKNPRTIGSWLWVCYDLWFHYRHTMDDTMLRNSVYPPCAIPRYSARRHCYRYDGRFHLQNMQSPEYSPTGQDFPDTNYNLAMIQWGCETLIDAAAKLEIDEPLLPRCREVLSRLTAPPMDTDGTLMIAAGVPYAYSHRHYSHLIGIYPLHLYDWENPSQRLMIERSVRRWFDTDHGGHLAGYSFTGYASMMAGMGKGDEAVDALGKFVNGVKGRYILGANTLYFEAGGQAEVIETPLSAAQCVQELLMQSWGDKIRIFPALPSAWNDVSFHDLRTEGAFLVSASRKNGVTEFVRVKSLMGEPCRIKIGDGERMRVMGDTIKVSSGSDGVLTLDLEKGQEAVLIPAGAPARPCVITPVATHSNTNPFGLKS